MAVLPTYLNQANIEPSGITPASTSNFGSILSDIGEKVSDLTLAWKEKQNDIEFQMAKNLYLEKTTKLLGRANNDHDYTTGAELNEKNSRYTKSMAQILPEVMEGISNQQTRERFAMEMHIPDVKNKLEIDDIFRNKFIDRAKSELQKSSENNYNAFLKTGSTDFMNNYSNDLERMFIAGVINKDTQQKMLGDLKYWYVDRAWNVVDYDDALSAERTIRKYFENPNADKRARSALNYLDSLKDLYNKTQRDIEKGKIDEIEQRRLIELNKEQEINYYDLNKTKEEIFKNIKDRDENNLNYDEAVQNVINLFDLMMATEEKENKGLLKRDDAKKLGKEVMEKIEDETHFDKWFFGLLWDDNPNFDDNAFFNFQWRDCALEAMMKEIGRVRLDNKPDNRAYRNIIMSAYKMARENNLNFLDRSFSEKGRARDIVKKVINEMIDGDIPDTADRIIFGDEELIYYNKYGKKNEINAGSKKIRTTSPYSIERKDGAYYKFFKDFAGNYSDKSIRIRLPDLYNEEEQDKILEDTKGNK